jgi:hypothetical protein
MRYTVDPRVGSAKKQRSLKERQRDQCPHEGPRTPARTTAIRPAEPAPALVAADQIANILIRYARWLQGRDRRACGTAGR